MQVAVNLVNGGGGGLKDEKVKQTYRPGGRGKWGG